MTLLTIWWLKVELQFDDIRKFNMVWRITMDKGNQMKDGHSEAFQNNMHKKKINPNNLITASFKHTTSKPESLSQKLLKDSNLTL